MKLLYLNSNRIAVKKNDVIFKEGDNAKEIYIISKGEFLMTKLAMIGKPDKKSKI